MEVVAPESDGESGAFSGDPRTADRPQTTDRPARVTDPPTFASSAELNIISTEPRRVTFAPARRFTGAPALPRSARQLLLLLPPPPPFK